MRLDKQGSSEGDVNTVTTLVAGVRVTLNIRITKFILVDKLRFLHFDYFYHF